MEDGSGTGCYFHPTEVLVGVCSLCLKERLLILASNKQGRAFRKFQSVAIVIVRKTFSLRSFPRRHWENDHKDSSDDDDDSSFISMEFEDDGKASWNENNKTSSAVVEHRGQLRWRYWRRKVSQLLHLRRYVRG